jgi:deazaflavin-dependent oxidoreductase (nitroreductase family)
VTRRLPRSAYLAIGRIGRSHVVRRLHPPLYRRFHGAAFLGRSMGCETILLQTTGARSGRPRTAPLYAFPAGDAPGAARAQATADEPPVLVVVASNGGAGHPPAWYRNLRAHPEGVVVHASRSWAVWARDAAGDERERLWRSVNAVYPGFDDYQSIAPTPIPVVVLEPVAER